MEKYGKDYWLELKIVHYLFTDSVAMFLNGVLISGVELNTEDEIGSRTIHISKAVLNKAMNLKENHHHIVE